MAFLRKLFGGAAASGSKASKAGVLSCRGCGERYDLDHVVTASDDDVMNMLTKSGATVLGKLSGRGPVMVAHLTRGSTSSEDQKTLQNLRRGPKNDWQCSKCHAKGSWTASYSV
jgi:hypothetical protein